MWPDAQTLEYAESLAFGSAICVIPGTGSYIVDLVAKTPVQEIHLFDGDVFGQHNAFRAPGAPGGEDFGANKAQYWAGLYAQMRTGVIAHPYAIDEANAGELTGMDFVFLAMDPGPGKAYAVAALLGAEVPFIDVGMGVAEEDGQIAGILRVTANTRERPAGGLIPSAEGGPDDYRDNVQIADLNALSAALAVIRWKKHSGFYRDLGNEIESWFVIDTNDLTNVRGG